MIDVDSGESGRSQNGVVGAEGFDLRYLVNREERAALSVGVPQSRSACAAVIFKPLPHPSISPYAGLRTSVNRPLGYSSQLSSPDGPCGAPTPFVAEVPNPFFGAGGSALFFKLHSASWLASEGDIDNAFICLAGDPSPDGIGSSPIS